MAADPHAGAVRGVAKRPARPHGMNKTMLLMVAAADAVTNSPASGMGAAMTAATAVVVVVVGGAMAAAVTATIGVRAASEVLLLAGPGRVGDCLGRGAPAREAAEVPTEISGLVTRRKSAMTLLMTQTRPGMEMTTVIVTTAEACKAAEFPGEAAEPLHVT